MNAGTTAYPSDRLDPQMKTEEKSANVSVFDTQREDHGEHGASVTQQHSGVATTRDSVAYGSPIRERVTVTGSASTFRNLDS